jgi:hypothetical protein
MMSVWVGHDLAVGLAHVLGATGRRFFNSGTVQRVRR